jgi:hypothetical protein
MLIVFKSSPLFFLDTRKCKCSIAQRRLIGFPNVIQDNQLWRNYTVGTDLRSAPTPRGIKDPIIVPPEGGQKRDRAVTPSRKLRLQLGALLIPRGVGLK